MTRTTMLWYATLHKLSPSPASPLMTLSDVILLWFDTLLSSILYHKDTDEHFFTSWICIWRYSKWSLSFCFIIFITGITFLLSCLTNGDIFWNIYLFMGNLVSTRSAAHAVGETYMFQRAIHCTTNIFLSNIIKDILYCT